MLVFSQLTHACMEKSCHRILTSVSIKICLSFQLRWHFRSSHPEIDICFSQKQIRERSWKNWKIWKSEKSKHNWRSCKKSTGNSKVNLAEDDLNEDFDPAEHDWLMKVRIDLLICYQILCTEETSLIHDKSRPTAIIILKFRSPQSAKKCSKMSKSDYEICHLA